MKATPWTAEEDATLREMTMAGNNYQEVADAMPGRTYAAVKCRMRYVNLTKEQFAEANRKKRARRVTPAHYRKWDEIKHTVAPPEVIEDARQRAMAPRSLTAILMGDPAPGQSALERRA